MVSSTKGKHCKANSAIKFILFTVLLLSSNQAYAGFIDELLQSSKKIIGSISGGTGTDVFEVTMKATAVSDSQIAKDNVDILNAKFTCDLRKAEKRICSHKNRLYFRSMMMKNRQRGFYDFVIEGYEREPEIHDAYFVMNKDWARSYGFSVEKNKPFTFNYDELPLDKNNPMRASLQYKGVDVVDLELFIREIEPKK